MRNRSDDSRIGLYRPGMSSPFRREQLTVGREEILLDILDHLRSAADRKSKHHFLFLGPRGIGKSHLLAVIEDRLAEDPRLASRMVVARFPEESIRTLSFADLLKQLISILAVVLADEPQWKDLCVRLEQVQDSNEVVDLVVPLLRRTNEAKKRTIVVMVENLNELFSKQIRQDQQIGAIRKFFMDRNGCLLIGTAPMHFDAVTDVAQPFYDFFDTQLLQPFNKEQSVTLLHKTIALDGKSDTNAEKDLSHVVMALHDVTGGNPRLMVMTCELIVREKIETAKEILLRLVDRISPTYQASLAEMAPQERALMETLASIRGAKPRTPANIALKLGVSERQTSALLKRLTDARLVTFEINPDDKRSRSYCIRDGFLDVWLAVQAGEVTKRQLCLVAELLESFYNKKGGPFLQSGIPSDSFSMEQWPPNAPDFQNGQNSTYLAFIHSEIGDWVRGRNGELEELAVEISRMRLELTEKSVCKALLHKIKTILPETRDEAQALRFRLQSAYLHFLIKEDEESIRDLESVLDSTIESTGELAVLAKKNIEYTRPKASIQNHRSIRFPSIYISYAWGDSTPNGKQRQTAVDLLCSTLDAEEIPYQRDKDAIGAGASIRGFMERLSKGDKIIAVISEKYLLDSESCILFELFRAFRRSGFRPEELQQVIIPIILDDAKNLIRSRDERIGVAERWQIKADSQKERLTKVDPRATSSNEHTDVNDMMDMVERAPDMLAAINNLNIPRFQDLAKSNFAEVLTILRDASHSQEDLGRVEAVDQTSIREAPDRVGNYLAKQLDEASLFAQTKEIVDLYSQGCDWIKAGGSFATPLVRRRLYVRLANALLLDSEEKRIPNEGLDDALNLLDLADRENSDNDVELDALTLATRLMVDHLRGDDTKPLDGLKAIDHPVAFANRVRLLFLREQISEAFDLVHHNELNVRWAEIAAAIYIRLGRLSDAIAICESMRNGSIKGADDSSLNTIRYFRCLMLVADEFCRQKFPEGRVRIDFTTDTERSQLSELKNLLSPIVSKVFGAGRVSNGIELRSLEIAFNAAHLTCDNELATRIAKLMATANPISRRVPQLVHAGCLKTDADLLRRLKTDWPDSIEVSLSVCELTAFYLDDSATALSEIESLTKGKLDKGQKSRLATVLLTLYQRESSELRNKSFSLLAGLVGAEHYFLRMAEAVSAMEQRDWPLAEHLLNERGAPEDPEWLSLRATVLQRKGDLQSALVDLKTLCAMTSAPDVLRHAVTVALKIEPKEFGFASTILERLSRFPNERKNAERMLAEIGWESGTDEGLQRASQLYKKLYQESPSEPDLAKKAAICLRSLSEMDQAIALLEDLERDHPAFIEAFLLHADLLETQARSEDAFTLLDSESVRVRFWNELEFLHKYMHLGYMTDHELDAHKAMCQIRAIENGRPEQDKTLQAKNLEQLVEFFQERSKFFEQINEMVVRGQAPWTMHPFQQNTPILSAWAYRTQKLVPWETLSGRAHFSTYASNAFFRKVNEKGERQLASIEPPKEAEGVVADISALITLFKLGLLEKAADYFGTIYIPSAYREIELFEAKKLQPHQLSTVEQSHRLFEMMIRGQLRRPNENAIEIETVDYQTEADPKSYSVGDVVLWLKQSGHVSKERFNKLATGQSLIVSGREGIESLLISSRCQFSLFAIQTLESAGLLDTLVEHYRVTLTAAGVSELEQGQFAFELQTRTARESREFWRILRDNSRFQYKGLNRSRSMQGSEDEAKDGVNNDQSDEIFRLSLTSYELAKERVVSLLADDRVLHMIAQNESDGRHCVAFSTLELLSSLEHHGSFSPDDRLEYTLQLVNWRYRFLKIDHQLLLHAAKLTLESGKTPGVHLKRIARYVQDCMLDIGLFGGEENVTPRVSIAVELYAYWTRTVARFINQLWTDDAFTDEIAESFTRWAIDSLLPSFPVSVQPDVQIGLSENQAKLVLIHVLSDRGAYANTTRSAKFMQVLQDAMGMSHAEFCLAVFNLVKTDDDGEGTGLSAEKWSRVQQVYSRGIAKHALAPFNHDGGYQIDSRGAALLEASKSLRIRPSEQDVPEHVLNVLKDFENEYVLKTAPYGPLVFHRQPDGIGTSAFEASDLLIHPNSKSREAVVVYFHQLAMRSEGILSERLKKAIKDQSKKISQKRAINWYPAAEDLVQTIENDWQLNLAGFRQVLLTKNQELIHCYWYRCIRPRFHPAHTLPTSSFHACTDSMAMKDRVFPAISEQAAKTGVVSAYCNHLGHLPLVDEWSLSDVVRRTTFSLSTDEILKLADDDHYFSAYHGCVALVARWGTLNEAQQNRAAKLLSDFVCLSRIHDLSTPRGRFWACLNRLANHFLAWISLYGPEVGDDNSASLAWWMAERLTKVVCEDVEGNKDPQSNMSFVLERNVVPIVHFGFSMNQLIRGGATSSVFHTSTNLIQYGGPFFASLIACFKLKCGPIYSLLNEQAKSEVDDWMCLNAMHQPVGLPNQGSLLFSNYVTDLHTTTEQWGIMLNSDEESDATLSLLQSECAKLTDTSSLEEILSTFDKLSENKKTVWLDRMKAAVWRQAIPLDPILALLRDPTRSRLFVQSMKLDQLSMAIELMLSIQQFGGETWKRELSHRLVDWLGLVTTLEERALIFNGIVCSSIAGESPSAIDRVREQEDFVQLKDAFEFQEDRLESARGVVPRWTWAKLRIYLDRLKCVN